MKHMLRISVSLLIAVCLVLPFSGCGDSDLTIPLPDASKLPAPGLIGFIIDDADTTQDQYLAMYSFLTTASELGKNAKLYRTSSGDDFNALISKAIDDGCGGVVVAGGYDLSALTDAGIAAVTLFGKSENAHVFSVTISEDEHYTEVARVLADIYNQGGNTFDKVLVSGAKADDAVSKISDVFADEVAGADAQVIAYMAGDADADLLQNDSKIGGVFATDAQATSDMMQAISGIDRTDITVIGTDMNSDTAALLSDGLLYALCLNPIYDAAAQATSMLCAVIQDGVDAGRDVVLNRHILTADTVDKYLSDIDAALILFGQKSAPTKTTAPDNTPNPTNAAQTETPAP